MGHYASEMADLDPGPQKPRKKVALKDKPIDMRGGQEPGSRTDPTEKVEYAISYDKWDSAYQYRRDEAGDPELWRYQPYLHILGDWDEAHAIEFGIRQAQYNGEQDKTGRPGQVLRRTVTYGAWEVVAETDESKEGWY